MIGKMKALGLALLAVMPVGAVAASSAQAAAEVHIATSNNTVVTGEQVASGVHTLQIGTNNITCSTANLEATVNGSGIPQQTITSEITATATYDGCKFMQEPVQVNMNGCKYTLKGQPTATTYQAQVTGCTASKVITISIATCKVTVGNQGELAHVIIRNTTSSSSGNPDQKDVDAEVTVNGIVFSTDGFGCPGGSSTAELVGNTTVRAYEDTGQTQVTDEMDPANKHQYNRNEHNSTQFQLLAT